MAADQEYIEYLLDLLEPIGRVESGRFFGGTGLTCDSVQFGMVMGTTLYFVVDDSTRPDYEAAGMSPFSYSTKKREVLVKRYYEVPVEILEDREALIDWAAESIEIARKKKKK